MCYNFLRYNSLTLLKVMSILRIIGLGLFAVGIFGIALWILLTVPNLQVPGLYLMMLVGIFGIAVVIWAVFKRGINWHGTPATVSTNELWFIRLGTVGMFLKVFTDLMTGGSVFWIIVQFSLGVYGIYWLWKRPKS